MRRIDTIGAAIVLAWAVAIAAQATGLAAAVHHDTLLEDGPPAWLAVPAFLASWQLMIVAMMLPSSMPLVRLFTAAARSQPQPRVALGAFLAGYAVVWSTFGMFALAFDVGIHRSVDSIAWVHDRAWVLPGLVLALAGAFQFTGLKDACLDRCRRPAQFMLRHYRRGAAGAFELGARHAVFCVGCCWALMLVMFAAGVTSLVLMALLTALMFFEKTQPAGARAVPVTGVLLLGLAAVVLPYSGYEAGVV